VYAAPARVTTGAAVRAEALADSPAGRHHGDGPCNRTQARLAVLIPVLNDQRGLERSLASLARDGSAFEVFVVDDGSDPPLRLPLDLPYGARLLRQDTNRGIVAALNAGLATIAGGGYEYVARLDAGDLSLPGRFAAQMAFLDDHPGHALVGTAIHYVDLDGNLLFDFHPPTTHDAVTRMLRYRAALAHPSIMIRIQALITCGFYRDTFMHGEDYELFMRLGRTHQLANLATPFVVMDVRPDSLSSNRQRNLINRLKLLVSYFDPKSVHAYLGIAANLLLLLAPRPIMLRFRRFGGMLRRAKRIPAAAQRWRNGLSGPHISPPFAEGEDEQQDYPVAGMPQEVAEHHERHDGDGHTQKRGRIDS
jgi:glycosyltransferase involved in cell wall biosynthesis